jgi:hypothetical protein
MEAITQNTVQYINDLVKNIVIPPLVDYINEQYQQSLTYKELEEVLQLNKTKFVNYQPKKSIQSNGSNYNKKCIWEYKRGKYKGDLCGKPTVDDSEYCSTCIKRSSFTAKPSSNNHSKLEIIPSEFPQSMEKDVVQTDLEVFDAENDLYKDQRFNFIFRKHDEETLYIVGRGDYKNEKMIHKLTHEDLIKIQSLNYLVDEDYLQDLN